MKQNQDVARLQEDVNFIRKIMAKTGGASNPQSIPLLWAAVNLIGWSLFDVSTAAAVVFWWSAVPIAMLASGFLANRHARAEGVDDCAIGRRTLWHWLALPVAIILLSIILWDGRVQLSDPTLKQLILLIVGFSYSMAGLHLDRSFLPGGIAMIIGILIFGFVPVFASTLVGICICAGLVMGTYHIGTRR